jgi:hypothetical protein
MKLLYGGRFVRFDKGSLDDENDIKHDFTNAGDHGNIVPIFYKKKSLPVSYLRMP